ncbi:MAG: amidohydrolase, partial [Anaerovibrio sp.]|uniref:amidohydrolase n=1 Tax=Anaerovibrio sp. TaxID=1872532 RepID=UPI001B167736
MSNLLIKGAHVLLDDYAVKEADIAVKDTEILSIGHIPADFKADRTVDGSNHFAAPGFVNGHTHASMTMLRSYGDDMELMDWLNNRIWPTEAKMVEKDIRVGGELALLEMIKTGTTAYADMYGPHMESVIEATIKAGIRGVIARGAIGLFPAGRQILEDNVKLFENYHGAGDGLITIMMGVHAPYTCPPEFCEYARELAVKHQIPIHIHMNETQAEIKQIQEQYGKRPFKYIEDTGLFELPAIAAHCVWLDNEDIAIMKKHNISAIHNPGSNMKLASGVSPVPRLLKEGINVALGTDGASSNNNLDMLEEVRLAAMLHKVNELDPLAVPAKVALQLGTENGAKALLLDKVGKLTPGYTVLNEMRASGMRQTLDMPTVYYELAILDALKAIKGRWGILRDILKRLAAFHEGFTKEDRTYIYTILKWSS